MLDEAPLHGGLQLGRCVGSERAAAGIRMLGDYLFP